jgi:DOPA 4,5-dioxygenase
MSERTVKGYHAHIYYDPKRTRAAAEKVRAGLAQFNVQLGSWHDGPVGAASRRHVSSAVLQ